MLSLLLALLFSIQINKGGVLDFYVHVPENSIGIGLSVGCEAENSPVMDEARELDGTAHQEHFRFTDVPGGTTCYVDANVVIVEMRKDGKLHERTESGHTKAIMGY